MWALEVLKVVTLSDLIYLFIYFQNLGCNHTTAEAENTIQYMHK